MGYPYGGTRERPEAAWERDAELMQKAGINVVRMGEFTWGLCEPEEGKYDFGWLKRSMEVMGKVVRWLCTNPEAEQYNGRNIESQFFCHARGLLPGS